MRRIEKDFSQRLLSKDVWKRAAFLMRYHDPGEVSQPFNKEDYAPLALAIILSILGMIGIACLVWLLFG